MLHLYSTPKYVEYKQLIFYVLRLEGEAIEYPREVYMEEVWVVMGIVNRECRAISYRVEISIDGMRNDEVAHWC